LNESLQALSSIPLLISIDQEGGLVSRLNEKNGFPATQSQKYYGTKNDAGLTRSAPEAEGTPLRERGKRQRSPEEKCDNEQLWEEVGECVHGLSVPTRLPGAPRSV